MYSSIVSLSFLVNKTADESLVLAAWTFVLAVNINKLKNNEITNVRRIFIFLVICFLILLFCFLYY